MDLRNLEYFVTVADERSFERAAHKLFLTQSAVSQQIRRLETELGTSLIDRRTRPFTLTASGQSVYTMAQSMLRQAHSILAVSEEQQNGIDGVVRIGVTRSMLFSFATERIREIREQMTNARIEVLRDSTDRLLAEVANGSLDVVITNTKVSDESCVNPVVWNDPLILAYNVNTPLGAGEEGPIPVDTLTSTPIVTFSRSVAPANFDRMLGYFASLNMTPHLREVPASYVELLGYVKAGMGVAIVAQSVAKVLPLQDIRYIELAPALPALPVYCTWRPKTHNRLTEEVVRMLTDQEAVQRLNISGA